MTVLTSHDTLVVEGLVHHFCGLISLGPRGSRLPALVRVS
jgi:hypothetical protein